MTDQFTYSEIMHLVHKGLFVVAAPVVNGNGERRLSWFVALADAQALAHGHSPYKKARAAQGLTVLSYVRAQAARSGLTLA